MAAYILGIVDEVHDPALLNEYIGQVGPAITAHGGRYIFVSNDIKAIEGDRAPAVLGAVAFADMEQLQTFWESPANTAAKALRQRATRGGVLFVNAPDMP